MSSVSSSSDSGMANYYAKALAQLKDETDEQAKQTRHQHQEEIDRLENSHRQELLRKDREADSTVKNVKSDFEDAAIYEKQSNQAALERLREQTYDKRGQYAVEENSLANNYKKTINSLENEMHTTAQKQRDNQEENIQYLENNLRTALIKNEDDAQKTVNTLRKENLNSSDRQREEFKFDLDKVNKQLYNSRGEIEQSVPLDLYTKKIEEANKSLQLKDNVNQAIEQDLHDEYRSRNAEAARKTDNLVREINRSSNEQSKELQDKMKEMGAYDNKQVSQKLAELDASSRAREIYGKMDLRRNEEAHQGREDQLKHELASAEDIADRRTDDILKHKDNQMAEIVREENVRHHDDVKEVDEGHRRTIAHLKSDLERQRTFSEESQQNSTEREAKRSQENLESQSHNYENMIDRMDKNNRDKIANLERSLNQTITGETLPSPVQEESTRRPIVRQYEATLKEEVSKNKLNNQRLQDKHIEMEKGLKDKFDDTVTRTNRENLRDRAQERAEYTDIVNETETATSQRLLESDVNRGREVDNLIHKFGNMLDAQAKESDHVLQTNRDDAEIRFSAFRQEADMNFRNAQRASTVRQNELIRDYEKKLADQKTEYENQITDLKAQNQLDIRNLERRDQQALELHIKGNEQQNAQLEAKYRERERIMTQNQQDEMERIRRSYELHSQKKS